MLHVWSLLSSGSFVLMPPLDHVELLSVAVLLSSDRKRNFSRRVSCCRKQRSRMRAIKEQNATISGESLSSC